ncbi:MAG: SDR family oxidoreductase [Planctomycetota bacterium]|nr:SDR family oxidoreductase [Planctomycetota bacterium]
MNDWLQLKGKRVLVTGLSNRRSVAAFIGKELRAVGAHPIWMVRTEERREEVAKITGDDPVLCCDVREQDQIDQLAVDLKPFGPIDGLVHSIAFARYDGGEQPFHKTPREHFLEAIDVSCFSLIALAGALEDQLAAGASVVTISISTTTMAAESYGYMAPAKAALDSAVAFLAKSLASRNVRVNAVRAGLLKTRSSAGIPGYADAYLFAEQATLRHVGLTTEEVAQAALFLLSPRSSGIAGQGLQVDAGMGLNYFDRSILERATRFDGE